ncbi:MAG: ATP-binding cassette domain-containing protein [Dermatophilaceae bacterium]
MGAVVPVVVSDLVVHRGRRVAVDMVSLSASAGITAVLGPNGAGKSSLIGAITGQFGAHSGEVTWGGERVDGRRSRRFLAELGWLPQSLTFPGRMPVRSVIAYAAWLKKIAAPVVPDAVDQALAMADLTALADRRVGSLSGGERRRAGLAAAVVGSPAVLLLDEPTAGLDPLQRDDFHARVRGLGSSAVVLLAAHLLEDVAATASHVVVLDRGVVRFDGAITAFTAGSPVTVDTLRTAFARHVRPAA